MKTYTINADDMTLLMQRLPVSSTPVRAGFSYDGSTLTVQGTPDTTTIDAILANASWRTVMPTAMLNGYIATSQAAALAKGVTVNVNSGASTSALNVLSDGTNNTRADLSLLALYGQTNPTGNKTWIDNNGTATVLTGAQLVVLATLVGNWITNTYAAIPTILAAIAGGTITTNAQVDAAFAAVPTS